MRCRQIRPIEFYRFNVDAAVVGRTAPDDGVLARTCVRLRLGEEGILACCRNAVAGPRRGERLKNRIHAMAGRGLPDPVDHDEADAHAASASRWSVRRHALSKLSPRGP